MKYDMLAGALAALTLFGTATARADDTVKLAVGQRGNWDTSVSEVGQLAGIFKKHGLVLEIVYTSGAGETQQAVISGSVDIGVAAGVMGVFGAFSKGAPVRVIGAETTGANDLYWYVKADSSIKSLIRYGEPDEMADAVAFLAGPRSKYISGQVLRVDGGETLFPG